MAQPGQTLHLEEAARQFGVSTDELLELNAAGRLSAWQEGEQWLVSLESLHAAVEEGLLPNQSESHAETGGAEEPGQAEPASGVFDDLFQESNPVEEDSFNPDASPSELANKAEKYSSEEEVVLGEPAEEMILGEEEDSDELPPMIFDEEDDEAEDTEEIIRAAQARYAEEDEQEQSIFFDGPGEGRRNSGPRRPRLDEEPTEEVLDLSNESPSHLRFTPSDWDLLRSLPVVEEESLEDDDSFVPVYSDDDAIALPSDSDSDHVWATPQRNDSVIMRDNDFNGDLPKLAEEGDGYDEPPLLDEEPEMPTSAESEGMGDALGSDLDFPDIDLNVPGATVVMQGNRNVLEQLSSFSKAGSDSLATESDDNELSALSDPPSSTNSSSSFRNLLDELHSDAAAAAEAIEEPAAEPQLEPAELNPGAGDAIDEEASEDDDHLTNMSLSQFADLVDTDAAESDGEETIGDLLSTEAEEDDDEEISVLDLDADEIAAPEEVDEPGAGAPEAEASSETVSADTSENALYDDPTADQLRASGNLIVGEFSGIFSGTIDISGLVNSNETEPVEEISALEEAEGYQLNVTEASYQGPSPLVDEISALEEAEGFEPNVSEASYQGTSPLLEYSESLSSAPEPEPEDEPSIMEIAEAAAEQEAVPQAAPRVEPTSKFAPQEDEAAPPVSPALPPVTEPRSSSVPEPEHDWAADANLARQQRLSQVNLGEQFSMFAVAILLAFLTFLLFEVILVAFGGEEYQGRTLLLEPLLEWLLSLSQGPPETSS